MPSRASNNITTSSISNKKQQSTVGSSEATTNTSPNLITTSDIAASTTTNNTDVQEVILPAVALATSAKADKLYNHHDIAKLLKPTTTSALPAATGIMSSTDSNTTIKPTKSRDKSSLSQSKKKECEWPQDVIDDEFAQPCSKGKK
eukprot:4523026-Ditylum_brightwellii.AAC.1